MFLKRIDFPFVVMEVTSKDFQNIARRYGMRKNWDFKFLGACYYHVIFNLYNENVRRILIDRDYVKTTMVTILRTITNLFSLTEEVPNILVSSSLDLEIQLADLIAGAFRRVKPRMKMIRFDEKLLKHVY